MSLKKNFETLIDLYIEHIELFSNNPLYVWPNEIILHPENFGPFENVIFVIVDNKRMIKTKKQEKRVDYDAAKVLFDVEKVAIQLGITKAVWRLDYDFCRWFQPKQTSLINQLQKDNKYITYVSYNVICRMISKEQPLTLSEFQREIKEFFGDHMEVL